MSGDVQPRKKKKTTRRKHPVVSQAEGIEAPTEERPAPREQIRKQEDEAGRAVDVDEGGGLCSRVVFFVLLLSFVGTGMLVVCDYRSGQVGQMLGREAVWPNFQGIYLPQGLQLPTMVGIMDAMPSWEEVDGLGDAVREHFKDPVGVVRNIGEGIAQFFSDLYRVISGVGGKSAMGLVDAFLDFVTTLASVGSSFVEKFPSTISWLIAESGDFLHVVYLTIKAAIEDVIRFAKENFPFLHPAKNSHPPEDVYESTENIEISKPLAKLEIPETIETIEISKPIEKLEIPEPMKKIETSEPIKIVEVSEPEKKRKVFPEQGINTPNLPKETDLTDKEQLPLNAKTTDNDPVMDLPTEALEQLVEDDSKKTKQESVGDNVDFGTFITEPDFLDDVPKDNPVNEPLFVEEFALKSGDDQGKE